MSQEILHYRAKGAALSRSRAQDDPELIAARRALAAANLAAYVSRVVADAPDLNQEQRARIAALLLRPIPTTGGPDAA